MVISLRGATYKSVLLPYNGLVLVGVGVAEALDLARLAPKKPVQVRAHLIRLAFLERVALRASSLEQEDAKRKKITVFSQRKGRR
jgi:hypothetical protein